MTRQLYLIPALILLASATVLAASVHVRTADGSWTELEATEEDGTVGFSISPDDADAGRALVVINKPDWMVLEDETAPAVTRYAIGDAVEDVPADQPLTITGLGDTPDQRRVTLTVTDDANPIDTATAVLRIDGRPPVRPEIAAEDREGRSATFTLDLNEFGPGAWQGTFEVADLSPVRNALNVPVEFSIAGAQIAGNRQSATLSGGGAGFTVRADKRETVRVDAADVSAFLSLQPDGEKHLYVRDFADMQDLGAESGWHRVEATVNLEDIDGEPVTDEQVGVSVTMRFAVHGDIPAVLVTTTATNLAQTRSMYAFWGWLSGDGFVTSDGVEHEWSMGYDDVAPDRWLLLPSPTENEPGVGWISPGDFGQSRFGTMLLYTQPRKPTVETGEAVVTTFALMPATEIDEVAEVARRLVEEGVLELQ